jgi:hypothetical protein
LVAGDVTTRVALIEQKAGRGLTVTGRGLARAGRGANGNEGRGRPEGQAEDLDGAPPGVTWRR